MRKWHVFGLAGILAGLAWLLSAEAREFRSLRPIRAKVAVPEGAAPVAEIQPPDRTALQGAVKELMGSWNSGELNEKLGQEFYDKDRLLDSIGENVPRDARIDVLGIQNVQVLGQYQQESQDGRPVDILTSTVSATVRTQIEFNDPQRGFQRVDGTNEYILRITEEVER